MKKWRQVAVVMLCLMAALTMTMTADAKTKKKQPSGKVCSGVKWTYNKKSKTLTITGKGYAKITGFYGLERLKEIDKCKPFEECMNPPV